MKELGTGSADYHKKIKIGTNVLIKKMIIKTLNYSRPERVW